VSQSKTYLWLPAYLSAVLETDNALMPTRIYEALAAIEQRLLSSIEVGSDERREIENAQRGLLTLKAERVDCGQRFRDHRLLADDLPAGDGAVSRHWAANRGVPWNF
jgi:hypothetical protein